MLTQTIILAGLKAFEAFCLFLRSPQGQLQVAEWRADRVKMKADINGIVEWVKGIGKITTV